MKYSVVIPTRNREALLRQCIDSVQKALPKDAEIVVIRDFGKSEARNAGIAKAQGEIIAFIDDDCIADPEWLNELLKSFDDPSAGIAVGNTVYRNHGYECHFPERIVRNFGSWPGAGNIAYRKSVFDSVGGFDNFFDAYNNEDTEMAIRAVAAGFQIRTCAKAVVYHQPTFWKIDTLLASSRNASVWPILKKRYPGHFMFFNLSPACSFPSHFSCSFGEIFLVWRQGS